VRKISILDESYMALEGNIARSIDKADETVSGSREEAGELFDSLMSRVSDKANFHTDPEFINFKNDPNIGLLSIGDALSSAISDSLEKIREKKVMSLDDIALVSKAYAALTGVTADMHNDEVEEAVHFFGRQNTDIPDSAENVFVVQISESARQLAIEKMIQVQSVLMSSVNQLSRSISSGGDPELLRSSMENLWLIKTMLDPLVK
jgi:hypothetical protein